MATLKQLIDKYDKEWTKYGMGSTISYSRVVTELKECALAEPSNENGALPIPDVILSLPERENAINAFLKIQEWQVNYIQLARTTEVYKIAQKALTDLGYKGNEV